MHENLRVAGNALSRSINAQAEHWMRIGMLAELHPALDHREICQVLIRAEQAGGFDLATISASLSSLAAPALSTPSATSATSAPSPRTARKAGAPA
jgi:hypothetical protein